MTSKSYLVESQGGDSRLHAPLLELKNFEHLLSEAQARSALKQDDAGLASFVEDAERIVLDKCGFIDDGSALPQHETFLCTGRVHLT